MEIGEAQLELLVEPLEDPVAESQPADGPEAGQVPSGEEQVAIAAE